MPIDTGKERDLKEISRSLVSTVYLQRRLPSQCLSPGKIKEIKKERKVIQYIRAGLDES